MKGIKLLLAVLLAPLAFQAAADDAGDIARAATRRNTATTSVSSSRQKTTIPPQSQTSATSRSVNIEQATGTTRSRTTTPKITTITRPGTDATPQSDRTVQSVSARPAQNIQSRTTKISNRTTALSRTATTPERTTIRTVPQSTRSAISGRVATAGRSGISRTTASRNATAQPSASDMLTRDFSKCRTVFYDCMDEFCANKDAQLKRCACSTRINEFNSTKRSLSNVEDKLLDFSQRLLTVNMDKEDAAVLNQATEGEIAYSEADTSKSKQMLDEIAKKLNTSFNDSNFDQDLNAISLSLNIDSAFDTVDSLAGASTTTKSGTDLYAAALPVCRQMALEVCSSDDLKIAEGGYQMAIEQDCNTVKKSYQTQADQARTKVFESGALLDMSRLDIHQKRNSDDILTCKQKMLDMLTDTTVCGENLAKCLDTTGRYIDPTTGEAFLTLDLSGLGDLIHRPDSDSTWTTMPGNERFVSYLNSKKQYLEPAMENCQDISDYVWDSFLDDALAQIKLAQESKLEEVRQSCTTLTTQCMDETADSLAEFDARALSIFGIAADKTVNAMCSEIRTACTSLLDSTGGGTDWSTGITEIATEKTYESILSTCREVGRACIIQACTSISGNFGLCENINTSINRKSIINRTACWPEVLNCVNSAGSESIAKIQSQHQLTNIDTSTTQTADTTSKPSYYNFYTEMYGIDNKKQIWLSKSHISDESHTNETACVNDTDQNCVFDICAADCKNQTTAPVSEACYSCRLAERIWGNCEAEPTTELTEENDHNRIKTPLVDGIQDVNGTLLSWFAQNTGTANAADSCRDTSCGPGFQYANGQCLDKRGFTSDNVYCNTSRIEPISGITNCCTSGITDDFGNCCTSKQQTVATNITTGFLTDTATFAVNNIAAPQLTICTNGKPAQIIAVTTDAKTTSDTPNKIIYIVCLGDISWTGTSETDYPNGHKIKCSGEIIAIDTPYKKPGTLFEKPSSITYYDPTNGNCTAAQSYYKPNQNDKCTYDGTKWPDNNNCTTPQQTMVTINSCSN